jgi:hypothetical protein
MKKFLCLAAAAAVLTVPAGASRRQSGQDHGSQQNQASQTQPSPTAPVGQSQSQAGASNAQPDSLAAASRKAKAQLKETPKATKVFTNDNLPAAGGISTVGGTSSSEAPSDGANAKAASGNDEKAWRARFAQLRTKLQQDEDALAIQQRELGDLSVQHYDDPNEALRQGYTRSDINQKTADIDAKKKEIEADQQAIEDAEDELRKSGGDPGWSR